jgi:putative transposase
MKKQHLKLNETDRKYLTELLSKGQVKARIIRRAAALLQLNQGASLRQTAHTLGINANTVALWRNNYLKNGLQFLCDQPRSGRPIFFDGVQRAKVTALACSEPPAGYGTWTLRLLADKAVELELVEQISYSKVKQILKKMS